MTRNFAEMLSNTVLEHCTHFDWNFNVDRTRPRITGSRPASIDLGTGRASKAMLKAIITFAAGAPIIIPQQICSSEVAMIDCGIIAQDHGARRSRAAIVGLSRCRRNRSHDGGDRD